MAFDVQSLADTAPPSAFAARSYADVASVSLRSDTSVLSGPPSIFGHGSAPQPSASPKSISVAPTRSVDTGATAAPDACNDQRSLMPRNPHDHEDDGSSPNTDRKLVAGCCHVKLSRRMADDDAAVASVFGIGLGISLGLFAVVVATGVSVYYCCRCWRKRRERRQRGNEADDPARDHESVPLEDLPGPSAPEANQTTEDPPGEGLQGRSEARDYAAPGSQDAGPPAAESQTDRDESDEAPLVAEDRSSRSSTGSSNSVPRANDTESISDLQRPPPAHFSALG